MAHSAVGTKHFMCRAYGSPFLLVIVTTDYAKHPSGNPLLTHPLSLRLFIFSRTVILFSPATDNLII